MNIREPSGKPWPVLGTTLRPEDEDGGAEDEDGTIAAAVAASEPVDATVTGTSPFLSGEEAAGFESVAALEESAAAADADAA